MSGIVDYALSLELGTVFWCGDMIHIEGFDDVEEPLSDDVAVGLHVSSFDGLPKGVILTHDNLKTLVASIAYYFEDQQPIILQHSNWTSELSLFQILFALTSGGTLFLAADPSPANVAKIMLNQKITVTIATPSEYSLWFQQPLNMLSSCKSWKFAFSGGENLSSSVVRNFHELRNNHVELANFYGATETTIACCMGFVDYQAYATNKEGQLIPVGTALPNCQVWVGDHLGRCLPTAWTGDIWVAGPGVGTGHFGFESDEHRFQIHPNTGLRCFRTGDWGFINDTGVLFVTSRRLDGSIAQIGSFYVELGDISRTIVDQAKGKVMEAVAVLRTDDEREELQVQVFLVMKGASNAASRRYLKALLLGLNLPAYMRPTRAVIWDQMPRTSGGKIDRRALMAIHVPDSDIIQVT